MIPRYSRSEMSDIWSDQNKYATWLKVATTALEGMAKEGLVPEEAVAALKEKGNFDVERILEIEEEVKHDVIAFLTNVAEYVGPLSRYVHRGMTSNDLLDTTFGSQLKQSSSMILSALDRLIDVTLKRAEEFRHTPCIGRSHGIHAEPTSFGLKLLTWASELKRQRRRLKDAAADVAVGKLSGPVGTYASLPPSVEAHVMSSLGLQAESVATQIVHRDRHAAFFSALSQLGTSIERFAVEIRHLQRTEVREAEERFAKGQKGSSAMPHKRNPILSENLTGLARLLRGYALSAIENVPLWHERDISHSSVERVIAPDACIVCDFMLARFTGLVEGLVVYPERMQENIDYSRGLVYSGTLLVALVDKGVLREDAYSMVQRHALPTWEGGAALKERVQGDEEILKVLSAAEIDAVFDVNNHLKHVDMIFERVLKEE